MNQFHAAVSAVAESAARKERERKGLPEPNANEESGGDDTTVKSAEAISEEVFRHELAEYEKKWEGPLVHYGFGMALGAFYGTCAVGGKVENPVGIGAHQRQTGSRTPRQDRRFAGRSGFRNGISVGGPDRPASGTAISSAPNQTAALILNGIYSAHGGGKIRRATVESRPGGPRHLQRQRQ